MKRWLKVERPACSCTRSLSLFLAALASTRTPAAVLPGVCCPCGRTWLRLRDGQLFRVPDGEDHR
jgi:hypothetical protein